MTLYIIKRKDYKLYPQNLFGLVLSEKNRKSGIAVGVVAYFKKKDAINYMKELSNFAKYKLEYEIVKVTIKNQERKVA